MKHVILVDIDAIFDTRFGCIYEHMPEIVDDLLNSKWRNRRSEQVSVIDKRINDEDYTKWYSERTSNTLALSRPTNFIFELADFTNQLKEKVVNDNGLIDEAEIWLNLYPYHDLSAEEQADFRYGLELYLGNELPIKVCYFKPHEIDLMMMRESHILTYITYDIKVWFQAVFTGLHNKDRAVPYPKLTIIAPAILPKEDSLADMTQEEIDKIKDGNPFEFLKLYWAPFFGLHYCPIELMSILDIKDYANPQS